MDALRVVQHQPIIMIYDKAQSGEGLSVPKVPMSPRMTNLYYFSLFSLLLWQVFFIFLWNRSKYCVSVYSGHGDCSLAFDPLIVGFVPSENHQPQ